MDQRAPVQRVAADGPILSTTDLWGPEFYYDWFEDAASP